MPKQSRWEIFQGRPNQIHAGSLRVTLSPKKVFLINEAVYKAMNYPPAVELRYDPETRTIGLAPKDLRYNNAFPIKANPNRRRYNYRFIFAAPFCRHFQIQPNRTLLFTNIDIDNDGTLLLELTTTVAIGRGSR